MAAAYVALSVVLAIAALTVGLMIARRAFGAAPVSYDPKESASEAPQAKGPVGAREAQILYVAEAEDGHPAGPLVPPALASSV